MKSKFKYLLAVGMVIGVPVAQALPTSLSTGVDGSFDNLPDDSQEVNYTLSFLVGGVWQPYGGNPNLVVARPAAPVGSPEYPKQLIGAPGPWAAPDPSMQGKWISPWLNNPGELNEYDPWLSDPLGVYRYQRTVSITGGPGSWLGVQIGVDSDNPAAVWLDNSAGNNLIGTTAITSPLGVESFFDLTLVPGNNTLTFYVTNVFDIKNQLDRGNPSGLLVQSPKFEPTTVPDGGLSVALLGLGMAGLGWFRRKV